MDRSILSGDRSLGPSAGAGRVWAARFDPASFPVLGATAAQVGLLREAQDEVDAHLLSELIGDDPLMCLRVMAHVSKLRGREDGSGPETFLGALVMLGIPPFFDLVGQLQTVEERLRELPLAHDGFLRVLARSHRAARFAMGFAVHRMDHDAAVIHQAALLHDFAELLLWLELPDHALEIARRQAKDASLRTSVAQREVLGVELTVLQHHLMELWQLPSLLVSISDDTAPKPTPQAVNVRLAIRIARHSASGWDNPALPDDFAEVAALLQLSPVHAQRLVMELDEA